MSRRPRSERWARGGAMVAVAWFIACAKPAPFEPVEVRRAEWAYGGATGTELTTEHYRLRTTCTHPPLLRMMPDFLESCRSAYAELVPPLREPNEPSLCYLFQTRPQWERFTQEFSPQRARTYMLIRSGGYEERGVTVSHYGSMVTTLSVMAHEGLHQYLSQTRGGRIPAWVNEGLACYFEAFDVDLHGKPTFTPAKNLIRRNHLREALQADALFELPEILRTNAGRVVALPSSRVRTYYAQSWSMVYYLLHADPKTSEFGAGFRELLGDIGTDEMVRRAGAGPVEMGGEFGVAVFRAYVTEHLDDFQEDYVVFIRNLLGMEPV